MFNSQQYLDGLAETVAFFSAEFAESTSEVLWVAHVATDLRRLRITSYGGVDFEIMPFREIISDVLEIGSSGIILAHNHLSGDPTPSATDISATSRLCVISSEMHFTVLDHLVFAGNKWSSMRQLGII